MPVVDLLRTYFGVENRDDPRRVRERIVGKTLTLDRALEPGLPALLALLDVPVDDVAWQGADAVQRRQRTLDTVKRVLFAEARRQPVLLIVEDLHWIDTETQALLDSLIESLLTVSILLLVNYRPEFTHGGNGKTYYSPIRLDALWFWCLKGDFDQAAPLAERAVAIHRQWGFRRTLGMSASLLGHILALTGRIADAVALLEEGVREGDTFEATWLRCPRLHFLGEAYLLAGRLEQATRTAQPALSLARERRERGFEAWILRLEAEIAGVSGRGEDADAVYRAALALANELEMRPLVAHCHLGLGKLYERTGQREQARTHLTTATTMLRNMGMRFWLEQAEAERRRLV